MRVQQQAQASVQRLLLGHDRDLDHVISLVGEQLVRLLDPIEREPMRNERTQIHSARLNNAHEATHAFLTAWAKSRSNRVITKPGGEGVDGK